MKKILFTIALLTIFLSGGYVLASRLDSSLTAKPTSGSGLKVGLTAWYTFDGQDINSTQVLDKSGNNNTGTKTGTSVAAGKIGQAIKFFGTNRIDTGSDMIGTGADSICTWIYLKSYGTNSSGRIVDNGQLNFLASLGHLSFSSNSASSSIISTDGSITLNKWYFSCVTRDANGITNFYVNGLLSGTPNQNSGNPAAGTGDVFIGNVSTGIRGFDGLMDDLRIYSRVLSTSEIQALYKYGQNKVGSSFQNKPAGGDSLQSGLVFHHTFDGQNLTAVTSTDLVNSANNGTIIGTLQRTSGKLGQGLRFPGTTSNYINMPSAGTQVGTTTKTVSFWARVDSSNVDGTQPILSSGSANYYFGLGSGRTIFGSVNLNTTTPAQQTFSGGSYPIGKWFMGTMSEEITTPNTTTIRLYLNGALVSTGVFGKSAVPPIQTAYILGGFAFNTLLFNGWMDDVRVYSRVLSDSEVKALYQLGQETVGSSLQNEPASGNSLKSGLVGWWTMDGQDVNNTTIQDKSGIGNNLTRGGASNFFAPGKIGQGYKSISGIINSAVKNSPSNDLIIGNTGTISVWFRPTSLNLPAAAHYIASYSPGDQTRGWLFNQFGADWLIYWVGGAAKITVSNIFTVNKWYHLVVTNQNGALTAYVNNVSMGTGTSGGAITTTQQFAVGNGALSPAGIIDDVRIYNRALSATEVLELFNLGK